MIDKIKEYLKQFNEQFCKSQSNFEKIMENEAKFPKENIWNCKYCTNGNNGCKKCNPNDLRSGLHILSEDYYTIKKIKCKCEQQEVPGCNNCKQKGFLLLRIFNFSPYKRKRNYNSEFEQEFCDPDWEINMLKEQCKDYLEKQNQEYFVIDELNHHSYDNILECEFVAEFEKERFRKLATNKTSKENLLKILTESGAIEKIYKTLQEQFKKDSKDKLNSKLKIDLTCRFP